MSTDLINRAKVWCDETRAILKLAKINSAGSKEIKSRASKITDEFKSLIKQLKSGKASISQSEFDEYAAHFADVAERLKAASEQLDIAEVDRLSGKLSALKKDLAVQLETKNKSKKQQRLDERLQQNQALDKIKFEQDYLPLQARIESVLSWSVALSPKMLTAKQNLEVTNTRIVNAKVSGDFTTAVTVMETDLAGRLKTAEDALEAAKQHFETEFSKIADYAGAVNVVSKPMPEVAQEVQAFNTAKDVVERHRGHSDWVAASDALPELARTAKELVEAQETAIATAKANYEMAYTTEVKQAHEKAAEVVKNATDPMKKKLKPELSAFGSNAIAHDKAVAAGEWGTAEGVVPDLKSTADTLNSAKVKYDIEKQKYDTAKSELAELPEAQRIADLAIDELSNRVKKLNKEKANVAAAEEAGDWPEGELALGLLNTAAGDLIRRHTQWDAYAKAYTALIKQDIERATVVENLNPVSLSAEIGEFSNEKAKWETAVSKHQWLTAKKALAALAPKAKALADVKDRVEFEAAFPPLKIRADDAKTKSDGVKGMETLRAAVVDQGTTIDQKVTAKQYADANGLLNAWKVAIKAVEDRLADKVSYDNAAPAKISACDVTLADAEFVLKKYGSDAPGELVTLRAQLVGARKVVTDFVDLAKFAEAKGALVDLGNKTTAVETRLVTDRENFANHLANVMAKKIADLQARVQPLKARMTGVVGSPDLDTPNQTLTNLMAGLTPDSIRVWQAYDKLDEVFAKAEDHFRDYEAYNDAMKELEKRYVAASNVSQNVAALATPHATMVNARKAATDLRDQGKYVDAKAALPTFDTSIKVVEEALLAKAAYEKAAEPIVKREIAAGLVPVPEAVSGVESPLVALKAAVVEARLAVDNEVNAAKYAEAQAKLATLDAKASAVLAFQAKAAVTANDVQDPKVALQSLKDQEGGDTLLAKLVADLAASEPDSSPALKAAMELQFGVTLTAATTESTTTESTTTESTTTESTTTWSTTTGVTATSLAEMFQLLHETQCTTVLGPLRVRFEQAKTDSDSIAPMTTARNTMIAAEKAVKDEETAKRYAVALEKAPSFVTALEAVEALVKNRKAFKAAYDPVKRRYDTADAIALPSPLPTPEPELSKAKTAMTAAHLDVTTPESTGDYVTALAKVKPLDQAVNAVFAARAVEQAKTNPATAVAALDALDPGGPKVLDDFIAGLDKAHPKYHEVLQAALKKRFKLDVVDQFDKKTSPTASQHSESLKHLYDLFNMVPDRHVRDNTALTELKQYTDETGGADYTHYTDPNLTNWGQINLNCGRPGMTGPYASSDENKNLGHAQAFPDGIDDDCRPANNDPITYFDFATLHEVGHAVDWKAQFMAGHMDDDNYGGWKKYDNANALVTAAVDHFQGTLDFGFGDTQRDNVLSAFVGQTVAGSNPSTPVSPLATDLANTAKWNNAFDEIRKWGKIDRNWGICRTGSASKAAKVGDHVYHKDGSTWYRYNWSARSKGLTGYQFRAPAEWFAELYAGYYSGKLKKSHPFNNLITPLL